jgi:23S rRNA (adenine2503-C2)-methyltransferase
MACEPLATMPPEEIAALPGVPGTAHARALSKAAHDRLPPQLTRQYARVLDAHREALIARNAVVQRSFRDSGGTVKLALRYPDGARVETVLLSNGETGAPRRTLCLSSQVGCPMGCLFCHTGRLGFQRNLTRGEIIEQYLAARDRFGPASNIVFMGMGEPLLNADAVFAAAAVFAHPHGPEIPFKRITISTCGIPAGIRRLAAATFLGAGPGARPRLAVSLVTADAALRARLLPGATRIAAGASIGGLPAPGPPAPAAGAPAAEAPADPPAAALTALRSALAHYLHETARPLTIEIPLLGGVNDRPRDAAALCAFLDDLPRGEKIDVNLIRWNKVAGGHFAPPTEAAVDAFAARVISGGYPVTGRFPRGRSIAAACGQLGDVDAGLGRRAPGWH